MHVDFYININLSWIAYWLLCSFKNSIWRLFSFFAINIFYISHLGNMVNVQYLTWISFFFFILFFFFEGLAVLNQPRNSEIWCCRFGIYLKNSCNLALLYWEPCKYIDEYLFLLPPYTLPSPVQHNLCHHEIPELIASLTFPD